jgi:hypothetical protein
MDADVTADSISEHHREHHVNEICERKKSAVVIELSSNPILNGQHSEEVHSKDVMDRESSVEKASWLDALGWNSYVFLCICGLIWKPNSSASNILLNCWNVFIIITTFLPVLYFIACVMFNQYSESEEIVSFIFMGTVFVQCVGALVGTFYNAFRVPSYRENVDADHILKVTVVALAVSFFLSVFFVLGFSLESLGDFLAVFGFQVLLAPSVGGSFYFMLLDAYSALARIEDLTRMVQNNGSLTLREVKAARLSVHAIVSLGFIPNSVVMATALCNVAATFVFVILRGYFPSEGVMLVMITIAFSKEIIVALVGLWIIGQVNEASTRLAVVVTNHMTMKVLEESLEAGQSLAMVLNSLQADPIKFPITGMVLTRKDVALRFGLWLFGILLSSAERGK